MSQRDDEEWARAMILLCILFLAIAPGVVAILTVLLAR